MRGDGPSRLCLCSGTVLLLVADIEVRLHAGPKLGVIHIVGRESSDGEQRVGGQLGDVEVGGIVEVHMHDRAVVVDVHQRHLPAIRLIVHDTIGRHTTVHLNESSLVGSADRAGAHVFRRRNSSTA